jgi:hypothetical protein
LEYFPRIAARFPLIVIESPRVVDYRLHGANYQLQTWRQADFYDQLGEIQRSIISYAGIEDEKSKRDLLDERMASNLLYMLKLADRAGDRDLVRRTGKHIRPFRRWLTVRQRIGICAAAMTGRYPRFRRTKAPKSRLRD